MQNFPIMAMKPGDDVTVTVASATFQGIVQNWTNDANDGGFAVHVKLFGGGFQWFYVAQGAKFFR